ncbi:DNA internalization-related competence protein ComEC/Rec2 [Haliea sp. E1-2-M8]|uniref:DNA internalization-related competence protein ComEC/Rec2 n=1 Tax=Haliea sp. E1-2-M8 TaxID=3064706 RepID=UPI002725A2DE|nr:DNA internalization-related competence protein ComEC/Rec2 [Haliea sp. E1-2-M8]MDO8862393.1 DNA internalization-related competence protein ComEC/Rec2 [Haliea sp. E1-2-M8]
MRPALGGFVASVIAVGQAPFLPPLWVGTLLCLAGVLMLLWLRGHWRTLAACVIGAGLAVSYGQTLLERRLPDVCERVAMQVTGTVASLPRLTLLPDGRRRQRFEFESDPLPLAHCRGPRRLLLSAPGEPALAPGERWQFAVLLRRPWGLANPGSFNMQAWFAQTGIDAVGSVRSRVPALRLAEAGASASHQRYRQWLSGQILAALGEGAPSAILRAVVVADRSGLDHALWTLFRQYGISHLLVISGLHVGMVAACGFLLGGLLARVLTLAGVHRGSALGGPLCALLLATVYTALAGFSLATTRAWLMLLCFLLAVLCGRPGLSWNNLLLAAAVLLAVNPLTALGAGFWLSFGSVACLLWLALWRPRAGAAGRWLGTHGYMCLAMLPLSGWWFGGASQVAALANAALVPLMALAVVPLALLGVVLATFSSSLAGSIWMLAAWPLQQLLPLGQAWAQNHPGWLYATLTPTLPAVALALVALALAVVPLRGLLKLLLLPPLLLPLLLPLHGHRTAHADALQVIALDVGQGTAVLVYDRSHALLYDTGGGMPGGPDLADSVILPLLRSRGISRLDTLVVSHGDHDHSAGLDTLRRRLPLGALLVGADMAAAPGVTACRAGLAWRWPGGIRFQVLAPAAGESVSSNNGSCVLRLEAHGQRLLLPGDIGADRERELVRYWRESLASDWALAPHHGSNTSSSSAWLKQVDPAMVLYTHGRANHYGHPATAVRQRHAQQGIATYSTALEGALEWTLRPGRAPQLMAQRSRFPRYWEQ